MTTTQFPSQCLSDYNFIKGECPTPPYLKKKPKKYKKFDCPTIITTNPEELHSVPQDWPHDFYDFLRDPHQDISISQNDEEIKIREEHDG